MAEKITSIFDICEAYKTKLINGIYAD